MSLDANNLVRLIKKAAQDALQASSPFALKLGEVVSVSPLRIRINQKITIPATQLLLTNAVRDHVVRLTKEDGDDDEHEENAEENTPEEQEGDAGDPKRYTVHCALAVGEKVLLLRCDGGQKFIVLDRLEAP